MEYKKTKRTNQFIFESSKHAVKRQKINVNAQCKGILLSPVNPRKMSAAIKEFLNFLKTNYPNNYENEDPKNNENNVNSDSETKKSNVEKQLNEEINKINLEYQRFAPLRNIIKNFTFIKFNDANERDPSFIVSQIFSSTQEKNEKCRLRNICKIIPFDCICKPHLSPFIKTILPLIKENFSNGICTQENFKISSILKLLNVSEEKEAEEGMEIEAKNEEHLEEKKEEEKKEEKEEEKKEEKEAEKKEEKEAEEKIEVKTENKEELEEKKEEKIKEMENETKENGDEKKKAQETENENNKKEDNKKKIQDAKKDTSNESDKKISWGLIYKCSNTRTLTKKDVLTVLDNCIGNNYCVNLTKPDLAIIVYVTEIMCGISIIKDYDKTRKFNISSFNEDS